MATGPSTIYDMAGKLLTIVSQAFAEAGVLLPTDQYIYYGVTPVPTCPALVVSWERAWIGKAGVAEQVQPVLGPSMPTQFLVGRYGLWIIRCITNPLDGIQALRTPTPPQMQSDSLLIHTDAYVLAKAVHMAAKSGVFTDFAQGVALGPCIPIPVDGGIGGSYMTVDLDLY